METINYLLASKELILKLTLEHISLVSVAVGLAILTGVPIGIAITANERLAKTVL
ncbi:MAG: choline ABC transporter permease, partial [Arenicella sp.]